MPRISILAALIFAAAMAIGPAMAAPQFGTGPNADNSNADRTVDCTDMQYRYMPFCQLVGQTAPANTARRTNLATLNNCPVSDRVYVRTDPAGNRLYRCVPNSTRSSPQ